MDFVLQGHNYIQEIQTIAQIFFPNESVRTFEEVKKQGFILVSRLENRQAEGLVYQDGVMAASHSVVVEQNGEPVKDEKYAVQVALFYALKQYIPLETPWGTLTGIRPAKLVRELWQKGLTDREVVQLLQNRYDVSMDKIHLCLAVARKEKPVVARNDGNNVSLYIGIPFCPTRCLYCSFPSYSLKQYGSRVDDYIRLLLDELRFVAPYLKERRLESVYIGGGTPTALNEAQLERLLMGLGQTVDLGKTEEFTVEAGRPDTLNREKLGLLKEAGVSRISINPQTLRNATLERIGRAHTVEQFYDSYEMARLLGHDNINIDVIMGLPGESLEDTAFTLKGIRELQPENLTVHTLSVKRASRLKETLSRQDFTGVSQLATMLQKAVEIAKEMGMDPYYLYRQKNMLGNLENVGYGLPGYECLYNVQMMEEMQDIIAIGAGSVSKLVHLETNRIQRIFNVKSVDDYINRFPVMLNRKEIIYQGRGDTGEISGA